LQGGPLMHVIAGKAICLGEALQPEFRDYARAVIDNAQVLAEVLSSGGLSLVSGGTDNHLLLVDVTPLGIGGSAAEKSLDSCAITVNKNMIPFDQRKPMDPSGIRIGTPAITTRGMGPDEMRSIGQWMLRALQHPEDETVLSEIRQSVVSLCESFPVPAEQVAPV
ncbi:MAG: serine hydroxymethyltransferase, partial [Planctomycetales bacterium]|nr:serine hydroxymethyltransferase [Planctomycetales bacterium]